MKKFYTLYIVLVLVLCLSYGIFTGRNSEQESKSVDENVFVEEKSMENIDVKVVADQISDVEMYTIRSENSNINVYNSDNEIINQLNIDYDSLREYDKRQFDDGIVVGSLEEVYHIAEDFSEWKTAVTLFVTAVFC